MAVGALVGEPTYASDLNLLLPTVVVKPSVTPRTSTTTYAVDPDLSGIPLGLGTYSIRLLLFWNATTGFSTLKTQWRMTTGAWTAFTRGIIGPNTPSTGAVPGAQTTITTAAANDSADSIYQLAASTSWATVREESHNIVVTTAGTMGLYWAQNASSTNATSVQGGSAFHIQQIA